MQQSEIVQLAKNAGLSDENAVLASAVAMGESGGNPNAHTQDSDDNSYGLWQINMLGALGPARRALYGLKSNDDLFDPVVNAHVMSAMSAQGRNWAPWGAYTNGSYKRFMPSTAAGKQKLLTGLVTSVGGVVKGAQDTVGAVQDVATSAAQAVDALQRVGTWMAQPKNWVRVAYVTGGSALLVAALVNVISSTSAGKAALAAGRKAATKGLA